MSSFNTGDLVFFRHAKMSWVLANISGGSPNNWTVKTNDAERQTNGETFDRIRDTELSTCREDLLDETPNDLLSLTVLHDSTLLRCLYMRYFQDIVYTNIGAIVVALNPFNFKIPRYMDDQMEHYLAEGSTIEKNMPHSWAQAHNTYHEMIADSGNQCILISGESGAGKTEATKIVMKYLAAISCSRGTAEEKASGLAVGQKLSACSPILETFGNAKTVRNDNSSRFGKFMKVKFSSSGQLIGAQTSKYLLEKSRIVTAAENERVYHSFYLVVRGHLNGVLGLEGDKAYKSINAGKCLNNEEYNSADDFRMVTDAMSKIGMSNEEIESCWRVPAGILSILNVLFQADGEGSKVDPNSMKYLDNAVQNWMIDKEVLIRELTTTELIITGSAPIWKKLNPAAANDVRDALSKGLYDGLFSWLVEKSNQLCDVEQFNGNWIGLLDIFGFEDFVKNSFEQLCINLANETLQNHYNTYIFEKDMQECRAEGIDVAEITCPDNMPCLKLITDKGGILAYLDEECTLGKGTDVGFLEKVATAHVKHKFFEKKKISRDTFIVKHYAADVTYDVNGWREKNMDTLKDNMRTMMRASTNPLIAGLLEAPEPTGQRPKRQTVGGFFKDQVNKLMEVINSTNPHWIRCVKPHPAKKARMFDGIQTMNQLESSGVLGTVKIRKAGYPVRTLFEKFFARYRIIAGSRGEGKSHRDASILILEIAELTGKAHAQVGKTKVFMKSEAFPIIERKRNLCLLKHAVCLQSVGRGYRARIQANKDYAVFVHRRLIGLLMEEYRAYLKRSAEVREIRARWRKEAEEKYRHLRQDVEVQSSAARLKLYDETVAQAVEMHKALQRLLTLERERMEQRRAAREALFRAESSARVRLFEEAARYVDDVVEMYATELAIVNEMELADMQEIEVLRRDQVIETERRSRNQLWRSFQNVVCAQLVETLVRVTMQTRNWFERAEVVNREEMIQRFQTEKSATVARRNIGKLLKEYHEKAQLNSQARRAAERARDQQLFRLDALWKEELLRQRQSAAARPKETAAAAGFGAPQSLGLPSHVVSRIAQENAALWEQTQQKLNEAVPQSVATHNNNVTALSNRSTPLTTATVLSATTSAVTGFTTFAPSLRVPTAVSDHHNTTPHPTTAASPTVFVSPTTVNQTARSSFHSHNSTVVGDEVATPSYYVDPSPIALSTTEENAHYRFGQQQQQQPLLQRAPPIPLYPPYVPPMRFDDSSMTDHSSIAAGGHSPIPHHPQQWHSPHRPPTTPEEPHWVARTPSPAQQQSQSAAGGPLLSESAIRLPSLSPMMTPPAKGNHHHAQAMPPSAAAGPVVQIPVTQADWRALQYRPSASAAALDPWGHPAPISAAEMQRVVPSHFSPTKAQPTAGASNSAAGFTSPDLRTALSPPASEWQTPSHMVSSIKQSPGSTSSSVKRCKRWA